MDRQTGVVSRVSLFYSDFVKPHHKGPTTTSPRAFTIQTTHARRWNDKTNRNIWMPLYFIYVEIESCIMEIVWTARIKRLTWLFSGRWYLLVVKIDVNVLHVKIELVAGFNFIKKYRFLILGVFNSRPLHNRSLHQSPSAYLKFQKFRCSLSWRHRSLISSRSMCYMNL